MQARCERVTLLVFATMMLAAGDLYMTLTFLTTVGMVEANPIARLVMEHQSPAIIVLWKLATTALGLGILYKLRTRVGAEVGAWVCFIALAALAFHWLGYVRATSHAGDEYHVVASVTDDRFVRMVE